MTWLVVVIILGCLWEYLDNERALREARRMRRQMGESESEAVKPWPVSPSPHLLLGDMARPLMPLPQGRRLAKAAFRSHRLG